MHSSVPPPAADELPKPYDEEAIVYLEKLHQKSPLPENVAELNPYLCKPDHLPGGMWYLFHVCSAEGKSAEFGFWRQKEAASEIFTNSEISFWRSEYEFIGVLQGQEERTNWLMLEYKVTKNGPSDANTEKESEALCRVFRSDAPIVPKSDGSCHAIAEFCNYQYNGEDYLELNDLVDDLSRSSSSLNTSRTSLTFDEQYFDADALLLELENAAPNQPQQEKESSSGLSIEPVLQPAASGSVSAGVKGDGDQSGKNQKPDEKEGSSSSSGKKKAADVKTKGLKKYLCMIAF